MGWEQYSRRPGVWKSLISKPPRRLGAAQAFTPELRRFPARPRRFLCRSDEAEESRCSIEEDEVIAGRRRRECGERQ
jgi:hypothetical protein